MAAEKLARGNFPGGASVVVFEERVGWEKPCGGGLTTKALRCYPFLRSASTELNFVRELELWAANGASVRVGLREPLAIYSRGILNGLLLARAEEAGAEIIQDRVLDLQRARRGWQLAGRRETYQADYVVVAAGARSRLRRGLAEDFTAQDFMLTLGYYVPGADGLARVQFFENFEGYAWAFPRPDHRSIGICAKIGESRMAGLRERLHAFMRKFGYAVESATVYSHLLPSLTVESWSNLRLLGQGWALVGDAAGLVDPVTGEGIYYAMRSGELLADVLLAGETSSGQIPASSHDPGVHTGVYHPDREIHKGTPVAHQAGHCYAEWLRHWGL